SRVRRCASRGREKSVKKNRRFRPDTWVSNWPDGFLRLLEFALCTSNESDAYRDGGRLKIAKARRDANADRERAIRAAVPDATLRSHENSVNKNRRTRSAFRVVRARDAVATLRTESVSFGRRTAAVHPTITLASESDATATAAG